MVAKSGFLGTEPFYYEGGQAGCLLVHGFTGTPLEMGYLGRNLAERGLTVSGIQLAGHGTTALDMSRTSRGDWYKSAEDGLLQLREKCSEVFVAGLSMGGALTLLLCARHGDKIRAAASLSAAAVFKDWRIGLAGALSHFIKFFPASDSCDLTDVAANKTMKSYDRIPLRCVSELKMLTGDVRRELPAVNTPLVIMHGLKDKTLWPGNADYICYRASSVDKEVVYLKNSGHGITVDVEKDFVADRVFEHFAKYSTVMR